MGAIPLRADDPMDSPHNPGDEPAAVVSDAEPHPSDGLSLVDPQQVTALVKAVRKSVVVITFTGRNGKQQGLGSGFVLSEDGLIATNLHVIGEGRPIAVQLLNGDSHEVVSIHATDKSQDLAILKIDAHKLPALPLGNSQSLSAGEPLIAIGNPEGLKHSAVTGVSAVRQNFNGMDMIQLAMPIERGNSGGPVLNLQGEVVGLVTLKSLEQDNIGFAVAAERLVPLLEKPNPVAMSKWITIGAINARLWEAPQGGVRWTQRAGRIKASGTDAEIGGRSLCLWKGDLPAVPYEFEVNLSIDEEDGAAGLVFHVDEQGRHFGFYPSSGALRLARFDGPTVYSWNVLENVRSSHFDPDGWNRFKIRIEEKQFSCYCNDELIFESSDTTYQNGRVGLVKFRHTTAEFRQFLVASEIPSHRPDAKLTETVISTVAELPTARPARSDLVDKLAALGPASQSVLRNRADELELEAMRLRELSNSLHAAEVQAAIISEIESPEGATPNLLEATLHLARLDNAEIDVAQYVEQVDAMAAEFQKSTPLEADEATRFAAFQKYLFEDLGFHGSRTNYYNASNSYLNEVIDDREGMPITLSVLYIELARRCGFDVVGIGLPGHFIVQYRPQGTGARLVDPFEGGAEMTLEDAKLRVTQGRRIAWDDSFLAPVSSKEILERILRNLLNVVNTVEQPEQTLRYIDTILAINPNSMTDRLYRAVLCLNTGRIDEGIAEVDRVLESESQELVLERVHQLRDALLERKGDGE